MIPLAHVERIIPHVYVSRPSHPLIRAMNFYYNFISFFQNEAPFRRSNIFHITLKMKVRSSKASCRIVDKSLRIGMVYTQTGGKAGWSRLVSSGIGDFSRKISLTEYSRRQISTTCKTPHREHQSYT